MCELALIVHLKEPNHRADLFKRHWYEQNKSRMYAIYKLADLLT